MNSSDLRVFETVARLGGMGRAAAELNTVQSNVTSHIRRLEQELGTALFRRLPRGVEPTAAGQRLLPYAIKVAQLLDEARRAAMDDGAPQGQLVIGTLETTAALRLADRLTTYVSTYPQVDLALKTGTTCELLEQVVNHKLDGALVCGPVMHPELDAEAIFSEELVLLTSPDVASFDALARQHEVRIIVLRSGCSYRQRLEDILARRGIPSPRVLEFGTLEAVFGCVAAGLGVTLLPRALLGTVWGKGRVAVHELPAQDAEVDTVFVRRRDTAPFAALTAFVATMRPEEAAARHAKAQPRKKLAAAS